jgi:mono/diheme cytochrome c family protein
MGAREFGRGVVTAAILVVSGCTQRAGEPTVATPIEVTPVVSPQSVSRERGKYLVLVGGCNECHTPGYAMPGGGSIPESEWLTGVGLGWRGPWGTTYASNLRLSVAGADEQTWLATMRARKVFPPMPWGSLHAMTDADLRSVYQYIKGLGAKGEATPGYVLPGVEPKTPYLDMMPHVVAGAATRPGR